MNNVNYREISNWLLAKDLFYTWKEIFDYLSDNNHEFYIWFPFYNRRLLFKILPKKSLMRLNLKFDGIIPKDFDEVIQNIQIKRSDKKITDITPNISIKHIYLSDGSGYFTTPKLYHTTEFTISKHLYNTEYLDDYINILEKFVSNINLKDKKKLHKATTKWFNKKNKWTLISVWKCLNEIFEINFKFYFNLDHIINPDKKYCDYDDKLNIDTKEHYDMVIKHNEYMKKEREIKKLKRGI